MLALGAVDYSVLGGYLLLMLAVGFICRNISKNISDYVRMGCKSTWWLMGLSLFMQTFSAATFTGLCAQAFLGGWSGPLTIWSGAVGLFIQGWLFAPWLRRLRPITPGDVIRLRFGRTVEQLFVYFGALSPLFWGGFMLLGLSTFTAVLFNVPVLWVVIFAGVVVMFYSVSGGSWSVQITDNLQAFILIPVTIVVAALALNAIGGIDGLFDQIKKQGLQDEFAVVKPKDYKYPETTVKVKVHNSDQRGTYEANLAAAEMMFAAAEGNTAMPAPDKALLKTNLEKAQAALKKAQEEAKKKKLDIAALSQNSDEYHLEEKTIKISSFVGKGFHTIPWLLALIVSGIIGTANPGSAYRYLSAKDEKAGRWAAWLAAFLMLLGSLVWFIPPMVGRLLYASEIFSPEVMDNFKNPGEVAYAMVAQRVLPPGVLGLVLIAMFSATMSSMDSNLTGTAGLITNNIYPPLCRLFGWKEWTGKKLLRLTQVFNLMLGLWAMGAALLMDKFGSRAGLFDYMFNIIILIAAPIGTPFLLSFFVKKLPSWGPLVGTAFGFCVSIFYMFNVKILTGVFGMDPTEAANLFKFDIDGIAGNNGEWAWTTLWYHKVWIMWVFILIPTLLTTLFWKTTSKEYREKHVNEFFRRIHTPIDFEKEVGQNADTQQLKLVGGLGMVMGVMILPLMFFAKNPDGAMDWPGFWGVVFIGGFVIGVSGMLYYVGVRGSNSASLDTNVGEEPEYGVNFAHSDEDHPLQIEDETTHHPN